MDGHNSWPTLLLLIFLFGSACLPGGLAAEQGKSGFYLLKRCEECKLFLTDQTEVQGELITVRKDFLELDVREKPRNRPFQLQSHRETIPFDEIRLMQCGDPSYDGLIWGSMVGGFIGATVLGFMASIGREPGYEYEHTVQYYTAWGLLVGGGIGIPIGFLIDLATGYPQETMSVDEWLGRKR